MGGEPLTALAIAGLPRKGPGRETVAAIFRGGFDKLREAGVALLGGHTVQDQEIKFGYAVTGRIDPARVLSNAGARPGDVLLLTKALGTGIVATAIKARRAPAAVVEAAVRSMTTLNRAAAIALAGLPAGTVRACTDVTGFGLLGHACEMAAASRVRLDIVALEVPVLGGVLPLVRKHLTGGGMTNVEHFGPRIRGASEIDAGRLAVLYDPQTSGGLLVAVAADRASDALRALSAAGAGAVRIGEVAAPEAGGVLVTLRG
jgi:selenide, water dikinase